MHFETLYHELAHGAEQIRALTLGVTQDEARYKADHETWSILEVVCHLYDEEREDFRQRLDFILHQPAEPFPPIDPQGWVTERGYNQRDFAEMLDKFLLEREQSLAWLRSLESPDWNSTHTDQNGSVPAGEMLAAWVAHDNLHSRQLVELRRARLVRLAEPYVVEYAGEW